MAKNNETNLQNQILLDIGTRPDVLAWRQQVGLFRAYDNPERVVRVGTPGMADIGMIVQVEITPDMVGRTIGVAVQPEVKTLKGSQRKGQEDWMTAVEKRGGLYRLVRSTSDVLQVIDDAQAGRW